MSDPVTNVEIEDVLSSIRRLVSEEGRNEPRSERAEPERKADKLVLTPALRVTPADPEPVAETPETSSTLDPEAPWTDPGATLFEAAQAASDDAVKPDTMVLGAEHAVVDEDFAEPTEEMVEDLPKEAEDLSDAETVLENEEDEAEESDEFVEEISTEDLMPAEETAEVHAAETDSLSAKIEALETVIAETPDQWEPDGESADAYSGTPIETIKWQDHEPESEFSEVHEAELEESYDEPISVEETEAVADVAEPVNGADPVKEEDDRDFEEDRRSLTPDEAILDEESLRELVADIVREELQGALGERITRNVRKLVRREIHRALTAHELE